MILLLTKRSARRFSGNTTTFGFTEGIIFTSSEISVSKSLKKITPIRLHPNWLKNIVWQKEKSFRFALNKNKKPAQNEQAFFMQSKFILICLRHQNTNGFFFRQIFFRNILYVFCSNCFYIFGSN